VREVKVQDLNHERFNRYGSFTQLIDPDGDFIGSEPLQFYRDRVQLELGARTSPSLGVVRVMQRQNVVDMSEYHAYTCELILPLDGDILFHVAPAVAENIFPHEQAEVFRVPRGTAIIIRPGVWHHGPFAVDSECVHCAVLLPERAYENDSIVVKLSPNQQIKIV
jgi:ureidoglycolate lyase